MSDTSVSFAKDTSFYYDWNATCYLPEIVNQMDSNIDESTREIGGNASLRKQSIEILNSVAQGVMNPQEGFKTYLSALVNVVQKRIELSRIENEKAILYSYVLVAENYQESLENGYPLLQKLCFKPILSSVNEQFFLEMQQELYKKMHSELQTLQIPVKDIPVLDEGINFSEILTLVSQKLVGKEITKTIGEHTKCASVSQNVQAAIVNYFSELSQLSRAEKEASLNRLSSIKTSKTVQNLKLSATERALHAAALEALRGDRKTFEPRNMSLTLLKILSLAGAQFLQEKAPPSLLAQTTLGKQTLKEVIEKEAIKANVRPTKTTNRYLNQCTNSERVNQAATVFFKYLQSLPLAQQEAEISSLFKIKTVKSLGKAGLSSPAIALFGAALEAIRIAENSTSKNPLKMGHILANLVWLKANNAQA